jgi:hypothetical protein
MAAEEEKVTQELRERISSAAGEMLRIQADLEDLAQELAASDGKLAMQVASVVHDIHERTDYLHAITTTGAPDAMVVTIERCGGWTEDSKSERVAALEIDWNEENNRWEFAAVPIQLQPVAQKITEEIRAGEYQGWVHFSWSALPKPLVKPDR